MDLELHLKDNPTYEDVDNLQNEQIVYKYNTSVKLIFQWHIRILKAAYVFFSITKRSGRFYIFNVFNNAFHK